MAEPKKKVSIVSPMPPALMQESAGAVPKKKVSIVSPMPRAPATPSLDDMALSVKKHHRYLCPCCFLDLVKDKHPTRELITYVAALCFESVAHTVKMFRILKALRF